MPITHVLLNNAVLGKITKEQRAGRVRRVADRRCTTRTSPSTPSSAAPPASRVHRRDELDDALTALFADDGPALVDVDADAELV